MIKFGVFIGCGRKENEIKDDNEVNGVPLTEGGRLGEKQVWTYLS